MSRMRVTTAARYRSHITYWRKVLLRNGYKQDAKVFSKFFFQQGVYITVEEPFCDLSSDEDPAVFEDWEKLSRWFGSVRWSASIDTNDGLCIFGRAGWGDTPLEAIADIMQDVRDFSDGVLKEWQGLNLTTSRQRCRHG